MDIRIDIPASMYLMIFVGVFGTVWVICSFCVASFQKRLSVGQRRLMVVALLLFLSMDGLIVRRELMKAEARAEARALIESIALADHEVTVDGKRFADSGSIVDVLRRMKAVDANHSGPDLDTELSLSIADGERSITLAMVQDRRHRDEFWVFWSEYSGARGIYSAISRIESPELQEFLR